MSPAEIAAKLKRDGFALAPQLFNAATAEHLIDSLAEGEADRSKRAGETYGAQNLFGMVPVRHLARSPALREILASMLGNEVRAVRAIYFDKTPKANWPVAWHQDLSLALSERRDLPGWTNWTVKRDIPHVQAPPDILERMVTARIHLDDCPAENGALRVVTGSHLLGILPREQIESLTRQEPPAIITARAGDVLFMKPLLLHASSPAQHPSHRRVLHLEFATADLLPQEFTWAESV